MPRTDINLTSFVHVLLQLASRMRRETTTRNAQKDERTRVALRQEYAAMERTCRLASKRRAKDAEAVRLRIAAGSRHVADNDVPKMRELENANGDKAKRARALNGKDKVTSPRATAMPMSPSAMASLAIEADELKSDRGDGERDDDDVATAITADADDDDCDAPWSDFVMEWNAQQRKNAGKPSSSAGSGGHTDRGEKSNVSGGDRHTSSSYDKTAALGSAYPPRKPVKAPVSDEFLDRNYYDYVAMIRERERQARIGLDRYAFVWGTNTHSVKPFTTAPLKPGEKDKEDKAREKLEQQYTRDDAWRMYTNGLEYEPQLKRPPGVLQHTPGEVPPRSRSRTSHASSRATARAASQRMSPRPQSGGCVRPLLAATPTPRSDSQGHPQLVAEDNDVELQWMNNAMALKSRERPVRAQSAGVTRVGSGGGGSDSRRRRAMSSSAVHTDEFGYRDNLNTKGVGINVAAPMSQKAKAALARMQHTYRKKSSPLQRHDQDQQVRRSLSARSKHYYSSTARERHLCQHNAAMECRPASAHAVRRTMTSTGSDTARAQWPHSLKRFALPSTMPQQQMSTQSARAPSVPRQRRRIPS